MRAYPTTEITQHLQDLVSDVENGKISAYSAAQQAVNPDHGIYLIGTPESQPVHEKHYGRAYFDMEMQSWISIDATSSREPFDYDPSDQGIVFVTALARTAIMCAVFGDINQPDKQRVLSARPRPHFGWRPAPLCDEGVSLHALPELINSATEDLKGCIDIVTPLVQVDAHGFPQLGPGQYAYPTAARTLATIQLDGRDLPPDIEPITYDSFFG